MVDLAGPGWAGQDHYNHIASPPLSPLTNNWHTGFLPTTEHGRGLQTTGVLSVVSCLTNKQSKPSHSKWLLLGNWISQVHVHCSMLICLPLPWRGALNEKNYLIWLIRCLWPPSSKAEVPMIDLDSFIMKNYYRESDRRVGRVSDWFCPQSVIECS